MNLTDKPQHTLKDYLKVFFGKAHKDTVIHFFHSEASERSAEDEYLDEEPRGDFRELIGKCISFKNVDSYGGEGQGEDYWSVYKFTLDNEICWVKFNGWYSSYSGSEYSNFFFVEPKEVTVTKYFEV